MNSPKNDKNQSDDISYFERDFNQIQQKSKEISKNEIRKLNIELCKKYKYTSEVFHHDDFVQTWISFTDNCTEPLEVFSYMYRNKIGTKNEILYKRWFEYLLSERQFLYANQLLEKFNQENKNRSKSNSIRWNALFCLWREQLERELKDFYRNNFEGVVRLEINPIENQIEYLVNKYKRDTVGISHGDFEVILNKSLDKEIDKIMDDIYSIGPIKLECEWDLKHKTDLKDIDSALFFGHTKKAQKTAITLSDLFGALKKDKFCVYIDEEAQHHMLTELEKLVYENEYLSKRFIDEFENAIRVERRLTFSGKSKDEFWVKSDFREDLRIIRGEKNLSSVKLKTKKIVFNEECQNNNPNIPEKQRGKNEQNK